MEAIEEVPYLVKLDKVFNKLCNGYVVITNAYVIVDFKNTTINMKTRWP
jgi:hypothetical protein